MRLRLVVAALAVAFAPCLAAAGDVKRDFDKDYDFAKVKTFATKIGTRWGNPISEKRVTTEITEVLTAKGWTPAPEGEADALTGTATTTTTAYRVETLVVDIFDAKSKRLTFRGTAIAEVAENAEKNQKKLDKITAKMLKGFPPSRAQK